jgi:predicted dehydrogenase
VRDIGVVLDLMVHDIDIVLSLLGPGFGRIEALGAVRHGRHEDLVNAQLLHNGGCVVSIIASRVTPHKVRTLAVSQEDAYISLDYSTQEILIHRRTRPEYQVRPDHEIRYSVESLVERVFIHNTNPLEQELRHFIDCVSGVARPLVDSAADVETLRVASRILACVRGRA